MNFLTDFNPSIFSIPEREPPISRRTLIDAFQKAGIKNFRFHDLRHTFARLVQQGIDLYPVVKLLGHKTISVTTKYAHHSVDSLRKALEKIF